MGVFECFGAVLAIIFMLLLYKRIKNSCSNDRVEMSFRESMDLTDLPIVTFYNNNIRINFLLDTGATESVIDKTVCKGLNYSKINKTCTILGMEVNKIDTSYVKLDFEYRNRTYNDEFQVLDMSTAFSQVKADTGVTLSGILGSKFFKKYKYILNFDELIAYSKNV